MMRTLRNIALLLAVAWSLVLLPQHALAAPGEANLTCNNDGSVNSGYLFYLDSASNQHICYFGDLDNVNAWAHIFSYVICNFMTILNSVLSRVYCGMQFALTGILTAVITVYIAVFGLQTLMGTTQLNAREILTRLFKISCVWIFVTSSWWGIGIAFNFFLLLATEGVYWVMSAVPITGIESADSAVRQICHNNAAQSTGGVVRAFTHMDEVICNAIFGPMSKADNEVIGFFVAMGVIMPPIFGLAVYWLWMNFMILVRALISFLLGVSALAFLISLSPIFLSMMLFKATYQFFENWLKYMISFSLQIIIIFACIALWITITLYFVDFFNEISRTIFPYQKVELSGQAQQPTDSWSICPYNFDPNAGGQGPYVWCKDDNFNPKTNATDRKNQIRVSTLLLAEDPVSGDPINNTNYIFYIIYHLITLIVVAYAFDALMRDAPSIAVQLSGPQYTPLLGVGMGFNRYGQIMTRHSSADIKAGQGMSVPESLRGGISGAASKGASEGASGGLVKNFREALSRRRS